jgi:hypothetical protein
MSSPEEESVNILTYNIMTPVLPPFRIYGQIERARRVIDVVKSIRGKFKYDIDVIVVQEVIPEKIEKIVSKDLYSLGFVYKTNQLKQYFSLNGGIIIFSRYPFVKETNITFGDNCVGSDCFASKGACFVRVNKNGFYFNVIGTHMQSVIDLQSRQMIESQIVMMKDFIDSLGVSSIEPLFLCGDVNIDLYNDGDYIQKFMNTLQMTCPKIHTESHLFTVDPQINQLVGCDNPDEYQTKEWPNGCVDEYYRTLKCPCCLQRWLDYTLYSTRHLKPKGSFMWSFPAKVEPFSMNINFMQTVSNMQDVSDHFPVFGHFDFIIPYNGLESKSQPNTIAKESFSRTDKKKLTYFITWIVLISICFISILIFFIYRNRLEIKNKWNSIIKKKNIIK